MNIKDIIILILGILLLGMSITLGYMFYQQSKYPNPCDILVTSDTIFIHSIDTLFIPKEHIVYKERIITDTIHVHDTILYREQLHYEDSIASIYVSGVDPAIDSIYYYINRDTVVVNNDIIRYEKKHWKQSIGIGPYIGMGIGYDLINKNICASPTFGICINYSFGYTW